MNLLRQLHIACSYGTRRNLLCLLQRLKPRPEYPVTIRFHDEKAPVGYRHPQLHHPLDSLTRDGARIKLAFESLCLATVECHFKLDSQMPVHGAIHGATSEISRF